MKKRATPQRKNTTLLKKTNVVPTLLGSLILLIITGLLINVFIFGIGANQSDTVQAAVTETVTFTPRAPSDFANEDGSNIQTFSSAPKTIWFGTGQNTGNSYLGLRFTGDKGIPAGAQIISAALDLVPPQETWIGVHASIYAETAVNPESFSASSKPSQRGKTTISKAISDDVKWLGNSHYTYDITPVLQSLPNSSDRNTIAILVSGQSPSWGRKFISGDIGTDTTPKLVISYRLNSTTNPTTVPQPTTAPQPTSATNPTKRPTPTSIVMNPTTAPNPTSAPGGGSGGNGQNAASYGLWDPADAKYASAGPQKYPTCTKAFHDSYYVIATDGKKYPTWHPPVAVDPATGQKCSFGHEHGADPSKSAIWNEVQQHFYYDANNNGQMDAAEQARAGVPFGFANEQLDVYSAAKGMAIMRHEDHVGHKVEWANGEGDMDGGSFGSSTTGGVVIPIKTASANNKWTDSGAKCYYFTKVHQGVSTFDAFTNNLHEVIFFADCKGPSAKYDQKASITEMVQFGAPGEFTNLCTSAGDRTSPVILGKDANNSMWPGVRGQGTRSIIQRSCIEKYFLVPSGQFSMNMYEEWDASLRLQTAGGKTVMSGVNLTFDVEEANRYYYPGKPNNIGYTQDLCYETLANGNTARGTCNAAAKYGKISWNDTRADYKGIHRGMYFQGPTMENQGGSTVLYTDPFGKNGQTTPFTGSIKQDLTAKNVSYADFGQVDPRQNDHIHDDGEGTVHAPN